jgi:hypothetical protein
MTGDKRHGPGRRTADQTTRAKPKHWASIAISRHPVGAALLVAVAIAMIPLIMVLDQQGTIQTQADKISRQQEQLNALVRRSQKGRVTTATAFCRAINENGAANNKQTSVLQSIIVKSVTSSKPFDNLYRQFGLPPYRVRLRQAKQIAAQLQAGKVSALPCKGFADRIERELTAVPPPTRPPHIPANKK